eukprot:TRINITY_DN1557_c0_g1_i2.p2 TRINITY_DN1557_c0_g1~~TRINITY_DN1557_c0_g1_i2.p2  ORF type:complete len:365 (-),score=51.24 TRINITY_DN1557_c0_g1_i2:63-1157(-)
MKTFQLPLQENRFFRLSDDFYFYVKNIIQLNTYEENKQEFLQNPITQNQQQIVNSQQDLLTQNKQNRDLLTYKNELYNDPNDIEQTLDSTQQQNLETIKRNEEQRMNQQNFYGSNAQLETIKQNKSQRDNQQKYYQANENDTFKVQFDQQETIKRNQFQRQNQDSYYQQQNNPQLETLKKNTKQRQNQASYYSEEEQKISQQQQQEQMDMEYLKSKNQQINNYGQSLQNPAQQKKVLQSDSEITLVCSSTPESNKQLQGCQLCFNTQTSKKKIFLMGKGEQNDFKILDGKISGLHCQVKWDFDNGWQIGEQLIPEQARPSTNGTYFALKTRDQSNNSLFSDPWVLQKNMVIDIDGTQFLVKDLQ